MLKSSQIPQYNEEPKVWMRFLEKSAKGSYKAVDIYQRADMAYMIALTHNPKSVEDMSLEDYGAIFSERFPSEPPASSPQGLLDLAVTMGYFPQKLNLGNVPVRKIREYQDLWTRRQIVLPYDLFHDAIRLTFTQWSPQLCLDLMYADSLEYNSLAIVSGMLALCLTWPDAP